MRDRFVLELQAHETTLAALRRELLRRSFIGLWGQRLVLDPQSGWAFEADDGPVSGDALILIRLDPHLRVLRDGFALQDGSPAAGQLDLFSLPNVNSGRQHRRGPPAGWGGVAAEATALAGHTEPPRRAPAKVGT